MADPVDASVDDVSAPVAASIAESLHGAGLGGDSGRLDAEILLCHCLQKPRSYLYTRPEQTVASDVATQFHRLLVRRAGGEPIAYLLGEREFWSLPLQVTGATLIPRPETETLVEWALSLPVPASARVADLGTGSGAIALALASERPGWQVEAVDCSADALEIASANRQQLGLDNVTLVQSDWCQSLAHRDYALLVSNPPYIRADDPHLGQGDVRFEPQQALVSGADGLDALRTIVSAAPAYLTAGGWLLLEHGYDQREQVLSLLQVAGFSQLQSQRDLAGHWRVTGGLHAGAGEGALDAD